MSIFSFGMLRSFYYCLGNKEQNEIARFFCLKPEDLNSYLSALNIYRNACAHDERVYNLRLKSKVVRRNENNVKHEYNRVYIVVCKDILPTDDDTFDYISFLKSDYSATINDGVYSAVELFANGTFKEYVTIMNDTESILPSIPYPFSGFANLCTENKIGILLTEAGDILIINDKKLCYTKHNGRWVQCMADKIIEQMRQELTFEKDADITAIYQTIVDVSYSRGGACIGIVKSDELPSQLTEMIKAGLLQENTQNPKLLAIKRMISKPEDKIYRQKKFYELNRALRRELLELDGAMVLSSSGIIHVIGTIIKLDGSGSAGGGRTAAAMQLSEYGLAIKISQDGYVQLFKNRKVIMEIMT